MIQSLRNLKLRIRSIENTKKITRAMEMVSSAKLSRTKSPLLSSRTYVEKLGSMLFNILAASGNARHPFLEKDTGSGATTLCVITSDAGLCSAYNNTVIRAASTFMNSYKPGELRIISVGREGYTHFKKLGFSVINSYPELYGRYSDDITRKIYDDLTGQFLKGESGEIWLAYTYFASTLRHRPAIHKLLHIERPVAPVPKYIVEPGTKAILDELIPKYIFEKLRDIILNAFASEHAARMMAMKNATDNAADLLDTLTLQKNKARQAAITKEIIEIAMSAEALRG